MPPPAFDPAQLLEHAGWLQSLAVALVGDSPRAEDLAQETWLRALEHPPRRSGNLRGWLATVLRNLWRQERRLEGRRREREAGVAEQAHREATDVVERAETNRGLVEVVMELEEPFRTTILLRYFDGLAPAEIAQQLALPEATARSRLRRGLGRLRERLDARHGGDRSSWMAAMIGLSRGEGGTTSSLTTAGMGATGLGSMTGVLLMDAKFKLVLGLLLVTGGALLIPRWIESVPVQPDAPEALGVGEFEVLDEPRERAAEIESGPAHDKRTAVLAEPPPAAEDPEAEEPIVAPVEGRVLDVYARPLGSHPLLFRNRDGRSDELVSDPRGVFRLEDPTSGFVVSRAPGHTTILEAVIRLGSEIEPVLVVAPGVSLAGRVVDVAGEGVAGARLEVQLPSKLFRSFRVVLDASYDPERFATSAREGAFDLGSVACLEEAVLVVRRDGYVESRTSVPRVDQADMRIVLEFITLENAGLIGFVLDEGGAPVEGARVSAGLAIVRSAADGSFQFPAEVRREATSLVAVVPGLMPGREVALIGSEGPIWPDEILLRVGGEPLVLEGHVVDEAGAPAPGKRVWLSDGTLLGVEESTPVQLEAILAGLPSKNEVEASGSSVSGQPHSFWNCVTTDAEGRFRLRGLLDREYTVKIMDPETLVLVEGGPLHPTEGPIEITFPSESGHRSIQGTVRTADGIPVLNASVGVSRRSLQVEYGSGSSVSWDSTGEEVRSDDAGAFRLERVPRRGVKLLVHGEGLRYQVIDLEDDVEFNEFEIVVEREAAICHVQVELSGAIDRADSFQLLDATGSSHPLEIVRSGSKVSSTHADLVEGQSMVLRVREGEYELVLYKGDERIESQLVSIVPGEVVTLRL